MSERHLKREVPVNRRVKRRPPHPSVSPSLSPSPAARRRRTSLAVLRGGRLPKLSRPIEILKRCNSDPALLRAGGGGGENFGQRRFTPPEAEGVLFYSASSDNILLPWSPRKSLEVLESISRVSFDRNYFTLLANNHLSLKFFFCLNFSFSY